MVVNKIIDYFWQESQKKVDLFEIIFFCIPAEHLKFLPKLNSELMKIAKTGIIKKQNASRNVSRITEKISAI